MACVDAIARGFRENKTGYWSGVKTAFLNWAR